MKAISLPNVSRSRIDGFQIRTLPPTERTMAQAAESNFCTGYISGFLDMLSITPKPHATCAQGAMMESVVTAYAGYMKRHPEHMSDTMVYGLMESLFENFPCPTDTPPKP
jgi:hypothetical protein